MIHGRSLKGPSVGTCNILQTCVVVQVTQMLFIPQIIRLPRCVFACRISMTFTWAVIVEYACFERERSQSGPI